MLFVVRAGADARWMVAPPCDRTVRLPPGPLALRGATRTRATRARPASSRQKDRERSLDCSTIGLPPDALRPDGYTALQVSAPYRAGEAAAATAPLDACAALAMRRGTSREPRPSTRVQPNWRSWTTKNHRSAPRLTSSASTSMQASPSPQMTTSGASGCCATARPPFALERLRMMSGGCIAFRIKKVAYGAREKVRLMTPLEFLARLSALIPPPRYPLVRYHGVLASGSKWRRDVAPKPREPNFACARAAESPAKPAPPRAARSVPRERQPRREPVRADAAVKAHPIVRDEFCALPELAASSTASASRQPRRGPRGPATRPRCWPNSTRTDAKRRKERLESGCGLPCKRSNLSAIQPDCTALGPPIIDDLWSLARRLPLVRRTRLLQTMNWNAWAKTGELPERVGQWHDQRSRSRRGT